MPIHTHIRTRLLILQYEGSHFIALDGIDMESLIRIPVVPHLEIDVAREHAVDAANAVVVAESDALRKHGMLDMTAWNCKVGWGGCDTIQFHDVMLLLPSLIHAAALPRGSRT